MTLCDMSVFDDIKINETNLHDFIVVAQGAEKLPEVKVEGPK